MKEVQKVEYRILEIMKLGTVKSEALVILKKEYNLNGVVLNNIWLDVKENKEKYENEKKKVDRKEKIKVKKRNEVEVNPPAKIESPGIVGEKSVVIKVESKPKLKIKKAEIEGEYGDYIVSNEGVKVGNKLFKNAGDIDAYRLKELEKFYSQLKEIKEVMAMI